MKFTLNKIHLLNTIMSSIILVKLPFELLYEYCFWVSRKKFLINNENTMHYLKTK